jgi:hypothetical protein
VRQAVRRRKESPGGLPELKDQTSPSPYDNRHCAGDTENGGEEQVIASQRKAPRAGKAPIPPWMWTLAYGDHEDRTPTHGYEATREAAMAAFAKSWWRE